MFPLIRPTTREEVEMAKLSEKFDDIMTGVADLINLKTIGNSAQRAKKLIEALENSPNKKFEVIGICGHCALSMSIPVVMILHRHKIICPNNKCKKEHSTHQNITYHDNNPY